MKIEKMLYSKKNIKTIEDILRKYKNEKNYQGYYVTCTELGKRYREINRFSDAIECNQAGLRMAKKECDTIYIIKLLNSIGVCFRRIGSLNDASSYHYRALSLFDLYSNKENEEIKKQRVIALNGIGNIHLTLGNIETADSVFRMSLKGEKEIGSALGQAINYANLGSILQIKGKTDSARLYYEKSMEMNIKAKSDLGIALCHIAFGKIHEEKEELDSAITEYKKAYDYLKTTKDKWHCLEACNSLANVYVKKNDVVAAEKYIAESKKMAIQTGSQERIAETSKIEYEYYKNIGNNDKALEALLNICSYYDKMHNTENYYNLQNIRVDYERQSKQKEVELIKESMNKEKKFNTILGISTIIIILMSAGFIFFLTYLIKMRSKNHKIMVELEKVRSRFFTNITHEFRTPLTVIIGLGKKLKEKKLKEDDNIESIGELVYKQGNELLELINQLLEIEKVQSAIGIPKYKHGDIIAFMRMVVESYKGLAHEKRIEITFAPSESVVMLDFIPDYMTKMMRNLISNAIKYTPEYGRIDITARSIKDNFIFKIEDNGRGIEPENLQYIFDIFYQGNNDKAHTGTGIGLALVKQIVETLKGTIKVESSLNVGTSFTISIPINTEIKEKGKTDALETETTKETVHNALFPVKEESKDTIPTLLIVEDNEDVARYIGMQVEGQYNISYARNGVEGLDKAKDIMPDIIITDLMMPEKDGLEFCRDVRASDILNHIPLVIISAKCSEKDRIEGIEAGADVYLFKPFNSEELNSVMKRLLEQKKTLRDKYSVSFQRNDDEEVTLSKYDQDFLNRFVDIVYKQMGTLSVDTDSVASAMFMTQKQLLRKIYTITGDNTSTYIQKIRMDYAKRMLKTKDIPISEVARKCGFEDLAYFSRVFKNQNKMSPTQFRRNFR